MHDRAAWMLLLCLGADGQAGGLESPVAQPLEQSVEQAAVHAGAAVRSPFPDPGAGSVLVQIEDGAVSVCLNQASLFDVLARLADQGGFVLELADSVHDGRVTETFASVPFPRAIGRLLRGHSYVLTMAPDARPPRPALLRILGMSTASPRTFQAAVTAPDVRALLRAIDPGSLPAGMYDNLLTLSHPPDATLADRVAALRETLIERLLERLEAGHDPASVERIRRLLLTIDGADERDAAAGVAD